jgi:hypothetical protein
MFINDCVLVKSALNFNLGSIFVHKNTLQHTKLLAVARESSFSEIDGSIFTRGAEFIKLSNIYFPEKI